ncbi:MAG: hypothetical protein EOO89_22485 [Pedobacter sp.]|nr:MAG: hypothetical protein EOO89_22485 [Pedobacter sp.]
MKELERLQAVNRFLKLEISKEKELQEIVRLAASICDTETALITLIDEDTQHIIFRHEFDFDQTLHELGIHRSLFSDVIHLDWNSKKYHFIKEMDGVIFIDNAYTERAEVHKHLNIPVFDVDALTVLVAFVVALFTTAGADFAVAGFDTTGCASPPLLISASLLLKEGARKCTTIQVESNGNKIPATVYTTPAVLN